jgi:hypothetical protein
MGKKRPGGNKTVAGRGRSRKVSARKSTRHTDTLLSMPREEKTAHFETITADELVKVFEESYSADLVNILLDLKKATVKRLFDLVAAARKRILTETATLYHYEEYLTNPLPLRVEIEPGRTMPNYYAILGVSRDASGEELKSAHRLLEKAYAATSFSPDRRRSGESRLADIQDAFNNLKNPARRAKADRLLPNISYLYPRRDQSWFEAVSRILA